MVIMADAQPISQLSISSTSSITPILTFCFDYSTYFGGTTDESGNGLVFDNGSTYITGYTSSTNLPIKNAYQNSNAGYEDAFLAKFSSNGSLLFSTYFGGGSSDYGNTIDVDKSGYIFIAGSTQSTNFPLKNAYNTTFVGVTDSFLAKFSSNGSLLFSTYLGGNYDNCLNIAIDSNGNVYMTGYSSSYVFPLKNAYNSTYGGGINQGDAYLTEFSNSGSLLFSTFLGGSGDEYGKGIAIDSNNNVYIVGSTTSSNFPMLQAINSTYGGNGDTFISEFNSSGSLLFSTYLGGSASDVANALTINSSNTIFITGYTSSTNFPTKNAINSTINGNEDIFLTELNSTHSIVYSTFFGGNNIEEAHGIATDSNGNIYIVGSTTSTNFPILNGFNTSLIGSENVFIVEFTASGKLLFSSYLGGSNFDISSTMFVDNNGIVYITGYTASANFPVKNAFESTFSGGSSKYGYDAFLTKLSPYDYIILTETITSTITTTSTSYVTTTTTSTSYITTTTTSTS